MGLPRRTGDLGAGAVDHSLPLPGSVHGARDHTTSGLADRHLRWRARLAAGRAGAAGMTGQHTARFYPPRRVHVPGPVRIPPHRAGAVAASVGNPVPGESLGDPH